VRIGSAKYSRLAQINLHTHIITFSRYAIENVPERGRRYLVIHELSHVKEASHNKRFWNYVAAHEPRYKEIGKELDRAFKQNVRADMRRSKSGLLYQTRLFPTTRNDDWDELRDSLAAAPSSDHAGEHEHEEPDEGEMWESFDDEDGEESDDEQATAEKGSGSGLLYPLDSGIIKAPAIELFDCNDGEFSSWERSSGGIVHGGSEFGDHVDGDYLDHF
jgi:hypothetical protein